MTTDTPRDVTAGGYRFLPGIAPFSSGAVAMPGFEVVHATLRAPMPWRDGFALIDRHLREQSRPRGALCAIELRSPAPFSFGGFDEFNAGYQALLKDWNLLVDGENPIARTNVAPVVGAPRGGHRARLRRGRGAAVRARDRRAPRHRARARLR